ncbi:GPI mannosyltransferase 1 [Dimargaris verticillata]|uniref:GPI mannosyltransferase 1 n=1 Tax=Dimargaris verticillata TaxID=2761393 RepID=A0A9W8EB76_9FUNG|nr:GPI mannosyltransferase 1 [Dimargaris verticillata]
MALSLCQVFAVAVVIRLVLLVYGLWQDEHFVVKYTDVDYKVFTDAAQYVWQGQSPYLRSTYRYTPLLAWLMVPNVLVHPAFGKLVFVAADLAVGYVMVRVTQQTQPCPGESRQRATAQAGLFPPYAIAATLLWLWNPFVANISTRGNAESLMGLLVLATLYTLCLGWHRTAAVCYGLAVHFKIYPIIYALPLMLALRRYDSVQTAPMSWWHVNRYQVEFALISAGVFVALNAVMYQLYGFEFLYETYLYHLTRKDHRHNFSLWCYPIYLTYSAPTSTVSALAAFLPQLGTTVALGALYASDIFFSAFIQTFAFVTYNKVVTSQYFMWYLSLLPIVLPFTSLKMRWRGLAMLGAWAGAQALWLRYAYLLEFEGQNTFVMLWVAGALFFLANNWILLEFIRHHTPVATFALARPRLKQA